MTSKRSSGGSVSYCAAIFSAETLAKYVGWGGLSMAFDENNAAWAEEFKELYASLSPEEYRAAKAELLQRNNRG